MAKKSKEDRFGLTSLILGMFAVIFMLIDIVGSPMGIFGFVLMILTFIFSSIQLKKNKNNLAIVGLILAFITLAIFLLGAVMTAQNQIENKEEVVGNIVSCDKYFFNEDKTEFNCEWTCKGVCEREGFDRYKAEVFSSLGGKCDCLCNGCRE